MLYLVHSGLMQGQYAFESSDVKVGRRGDWDVTGTTHLVAIVCDLRQHIGSGVIVRMYLQSRA